MELSLMEALGHMCILKDQDKAEEDEKHFDRFINYVSMLRSRKPESNEERKEAQEYFDELKSKLPQPPPKALEWDFDAIDKYTAQQNAAAKELEKEV